MKTSLSEEATREISGRLHEANSEFARKYPGESGRRQPVHTVYGGAHLFKADSARRLGSLAQRALDQFAPDFLTFARPGKFASQECNLVRLIEDSLKLLRKSREFTARHNAGQSAGPLNRASPVTGVAGGSEVDKDDDTGSASPSRDEGATEQA